MAFDGFRRLAVETSGAAAVRSAAPVGGRSISDNHGSSTGKHYRGNPDIRDGRVAGGGQIRRRDRKSDFGDSVGLDDDVIADEF